jgi:catalase
LSPGKTARGLLYADARDRLAHNIIGHVPRGVREPALSRVFEYQKEGVRASLDGNGK